jgi:hypothetical protein
MFRLLFGLIMFVLMPFRVLLVASIGLNILLLFTLNAYIQNDTYFYSQNKIQNVVENANKVLKESCTLKSICSLKLYASGMINGKEELKEFFFKTTESTSEVIKKITYKDFFQENPSPITQIFEELDFKTQIDNLTKAERSCGNPNDGSIICKDGDLIMVFESKKCGSCLNNFKKNFTNINQSFDRNILIELSHDANNVALKLFDDKNSEKNGIISKIKSKIKQIIY